MDEHRLGLFMEKVRVAENGCWLWTGAQAGTGWETREGYGMMAFGGTTHRAHRLAYEHFVGPIPDGLTIDHLCRVRHCVNPAHLEAVTLRENLLRGDTITAKNANATTCPKGHPYSGPNLYVDPRGHRQCKACRRVQFQAWKERQPSDASA